MREFDLNDFPADLIPEVTELIGLAAIIEGHSRQIAIDRLTEYAEKLHALKDAAESTVDFVENTGTVSSDPPSTVNFITGMRNKRFYLVAKRAIGQEVKYERKPLCS